MPSLTKSSTSQTSLFLYLITVLLIMYFLGYETSIDATILYLSSYSCISEDKNLGLYNHVNRGPFSIWLFPFKLAVLWPNTPLKLILVNSSVLYKYEPVSIKILYPLCQISKWSKSFWAALNLINGVFKSVVLFTSFIKRYPPLL